jgi:hypothetical protein
VSAYDASNAPVLYTLNFRDAADKRIESRLSQEDRLAMQEWLVADGLPESTIDLADTDALLALWEEALRARSAAARHDICQNAVLSAG